MQYQEIVEDVLLRLRRLTCNFSVLLKQMEKEVEIITRRILKLTEKRRKDDAKEKAKWEAEKREELKKLNKEERRMKIKYQVREQARKLENEFSNYRYYQNKKTR